MRCAQYIVRVTCSEIAIAAEAGDPVSTFWVLAAAQHVAGAVPLVLAVSHHVIQDIRLDAQAFELQ